MNECASPFDGTPPGSCRTAGPTSPVPSEGRPNPWRVRRRGSGINRALWVRSSPGPPNCRLPDPLAESAREAVEDEDEFDSEHRTPNTEGHPMTIQPYEIGICSWSVQAKSVPELSRILEQLGIDLVQ